MQGRIEISPGALIGGAVLLMILPLRWLLGAMAAAAVHELSHMGAILLCGGTVTGLCVGIGGARMRTGPMSPVRELFCAAAGPIGSFSMLLLARYLPAAALCGLVQGIFNMMPLYPLDGGRILRCGLEMVYPRISFSAIRLVEIGTKLLCICLLAIGIIRFEMWLMIPVLLPVLVTKYLPEKKPLQRFKTRGTIKEDQTEEVCL